MVPLRRLGPPEGTVKYALGRSIYLSTGQLAFIIILGSSIIIGVFTTGLIVFGRFLRAEKEKAERFREMHGKKKGEG